MDQRHPVPPGGGAVLDLMSSWVSRTKAVAIWQSLSDMGHGRLIGDHLRQAGNWTDVEFQDRAAHGPGQDPLYAVIARTVAEGCV
jgi:hypothetical protein